MASEGPSAAAKLMQQHAENTHHVTVEDAPDEDLQPTSAVDAPEAPPSWGPSSSAKAVGKQKAQPSGPIDTQSQEAFPSLGGPKTAPRSNITPIWGGANGKANGATSWSANATPRTSTPVSGTSTPGGAPPSMFIPGRNVESYVLEPSHILPRNQLKRPIADVVKDINRKSRAPITMTNGPNGSLKFNATGPQDKAQQALRDLIQQIGAKVSRHYLNALQSGDLANITFLSPL
jgi:hypothetical protein